MIELNSTRSDLTVRSRHNTQKHQPIRMQYTTLALSALLGAAAAVSAESQQHQVASAGHLRRQNNPTSLAAAAHQLSRVLQDPVAADVEDDHAHEEDEDGEHHEGDDEDEDHAEGGEMQKLPEWMTEEEEHHDDEHGEGEHHDEDEDLETAVAEGDEGEHHDEHEEGEEEGKSKC